MIYSLIKFHMSDNDGIFEYQTIGRIYQNENNFMLEFTEKGEEKVNCKVLYMNQLLRFERSGDVNVKFIFDINSKTNSTYLTNFGYKMNIDIYTQEVRVTKNEIYVQYVTSLDMNNVHKMSIKYQE